MDDPAESCSSDDRDGPLHLELHDGLSEESDSPLLNTMVRKTYFKYIKRILIEKASLLKISDEEICKHAQEIELNAVKICMSSMVYRYVMLSEISHLKFIKLNHVEFTEMSPIDPDQVTESIDGMRLFLQHYQAHTGNNCPVPLAANLQSSNKPKDSNIGPVTSQQELVEQIKIKSEPIAAQDSDHATPPGSPNIVPFTSQQESFEQIKIKSELIATEDNDPATPPFSPDTREQINIKLELIAAEDNELLTPLRSTKVREQNKIKSEPMIIDDNYYVIPSAFPKPGEKNNITSESIVIENNDQVTPRLPKNKEQIIPLQCRMISEDEIKIEKSLEYVFADSSQECITVNSSPESINIRKREEIEDKYNKVFKEMTEMFAAEEASCLVTKSPNNDVQSSPSSIISTDRYFAHHDRNFWFLEFEINKARFQQISSTMFELNEKRYEAVANKIKDIFGSDGSPIMESSPLSLKKVTQVCKERITWHVKKSLSLYYKKNRFRSADEFRILAKNIVTSIIQIDPFLGYKIIHKAINKVFAKKDLRFVQNISQIQNIVSRVHRYVVDMNKQSNLR